MKKVFHACTQLTLLLLVGGCGSFHLAQAWVPVDAEGTGESNSRDRVYEVIESYADRHGFQCTRSERLLNCASSGATTERTTPRTYVTGYRCLCTADAGAGDAAGGRLSIEFKPEEPAAGTADFLRTRDQLVGVLADADYTCDCAEAKVQEQLPAAEGAGGIGIILAEAYSDMVIVKYMQQSDRLGPPSADYRQHKEALLEELRRQFDNVRIR